MSFVSLLSKLIGALKRVLAVRLLKPLMNLGLFCWLQGGVIILVMGQSSPQKTCYMCDAIATSREDVPPRVFFPQQKDLPAGIDYRKNLIRVPSCRVHNSAKSADDMYLFLVILSAGGNLAAQRHFTKKAMRSIKRRASLVALITKNAMPAMWEGQETIAFDVDEERFGKAITHIAKGLYYHRYQEKWTEEMFVASPNLVAPANPKVNVNNQNFWRAAKGLLEDQPELGENLEIFSYRYYCDKPGGVYVVRMFFYESTVVIAASTPSHSKRQQSSPNPLPPKGLGE
ncbi:MAG: hypothetical protein GY796_14705 [Chloroflexi bacterium]|nr:hypothetical protein [Chloroflexota bacterium]